ncbi:MAG: hypothetical protein WAW73_09970, partial [Rhodoferax sp.]
FSTGQVHYTDGQSDALSATTLKADTEGVKLDTVKVVGADGKLQELDAGALIVHEGYDGKTRTNSYELQAKSIGDWEGTAEQEQHRHGGGTRFAKSLRVKSTCSPRETCAQSYVICSAKKIRAHAFRKSLCRGQNIPSPVHGVFT